MAGYNIQVPGMMYASGEFSTLPLTGYARFVVQVFDQNGKQSRTEYRDMSTVAAVVSTIGTASATSVLVDVTATPTQATINNNFATLAAAIAALSAKLNGTE